MSKYTVAEISRDPTHPGNEGAVIYTKRNAATFSLLELMITQYVRNDFTVEEYTEFMNCYSRVSAQETINRIKRNEMI